VLPAIFEKILPIVTPLSRMAGNTLGGFAIIIFLVFVPTNSFIKTLVLIVTPLLWLPAADILNAMPAILNTMPAILNTMPAILNTMPAILDTMPAILNATIAIAPLLAFAIAAPLVSASNSGNLVIAGMFLAVVRRHQLVPVRYSMTNLSV
jgi:hypothetical protein